MAQSTVTPQQFMEMLRRNPEVIQDPEVRNLIHTLNVPTRLDPAPVPGVRSFNDGREDEVIIEDGIVLEESNSTPHGLNHPDAISRPPQSRKTDEMFDVVKSYDRETICVFLLHNKQQHANQLLQRHRQRFEGTRQVVCIHSGTKGSTDAVSLLGTYVAEEVPMDVITLVNHAQLKKVKEFIRLIMARQPDVGIHIFVDEADATYPLVVKALSKLDQDTQNSPRLKCTLVTATMPADGKDANGMWK